MLILVNKFNLIKYIFFKKTNFNKEQQIKWLRTTQV